MKTPALVDELRTATAVRKESDLPRVVQFWAMRASCLNEDVIVERIREAAKEGNFTKPRFPFFRRRIEGSLPLDFRADFIGEAKTALISELDEHAALLKELGFAVAPDKSAMTLTAPVTVTPEGRELVGGEFIHTYSYALACRLLIKHLSSCLKHATGSRPRIRIEVRRRVDAPSCFVKSGTKFKNDSIGGYPASVRIFYSVKF